jgi:putative lipoprotein
MKRCLTMDVHQTYAEPTIEVKLPGSRWNVRAVNNGKQAVVTVPAGSRLELSFSDITNVLGSGGCNPFFAAYTATRSRIQFEAPASTRRLCAEPKGVMEQEAAFFAALQEVRSYELDGGRLQLRGAGGSLAVDLFAGVTGRVSYPRRATLPPEAELEVVLEDVSLADAPATVLARQRFGWSDPPPRAFELRYDPAKIDPRHSYALRARVTGADGQLLFTTTRSQPVITGDAPIAGALLKLDPVPDDPVP